VQAAVNDIKEMSKHRHAKKVLLHLTDGDPNSVACPVPNGDETEYARKLMLGVAEMADSAGIHMIGVGIAGQRVDHLYRDCVNVAGADAYEPVIKRIAKLIAQEIGHARKAA
jgi:hypothetical protein